MANKKQSDEEKRLKHKIKERERRRRIKSDPVLYEALKQKNKEKYARKKAEGKITKLHEKPRKIQKILKQKSRESSKKHYYKKKKEAELALNERLIDIPTDNTSENVPDPLTQFRVQSQRPSSITSDAGGSETFSAQVESNLRENFPASSRSFATKNTANCNIPVDLPSSSTRSQVVSACNIRENSPVPSSSLSQITNNCISPVNIPSPSSVSDCSDGSIHSRLRSYKYKSHDDHDVLQSSTPKRKTISKMNNFRKYKYRINKELKLLHNRITELKTANRNYQKTIMRLRHKDHKMRDNINTKQTPNVSTDEIQASQSASEQDTRLVTEIKKTIQSFYEEDDNSRMCPGKRECTTKNKVKKQKRFLTDSLQSLHEKFQRQYPTYAVSYSHFCKLRPFWVQIPNINARETCLCQTHDNFKLIALALSKSNIITKKSPKEILETLCCDATNLNCLKRKCETCKDKQLTYKDTDESDKVSYTTWTKKKKTYMKDGQEKSTLQTIKITIETTPLELVNEFKKKLDPYMNHIANITTQSRYIKRIKAELTDQTCIIHSDFSENYATKYAEEVQSFHFGSSRQQITLHTSVIYYKKNGINMTQSFCTVSESLRHDAIAIWEHLQPIFNFLEVEAPQIDSIFFISDSPSGQYRNRKMFYIMSCLHWNFPDLKCAEWNFTETGHGKGAPDGIGGCLKATADRLVARGNDIPDMQTFINRLKQSVKNVIIEVVTEANMMEKELLIPPNIPQFKGTMSVHQVIWNSDNQEYLAMRALSCLGEGCMHKCSQCPHGHHIGFFYLNPVNDAAIPKAKTNEKNQQNSVGRKRKMDTIEIELNTNKRNEIGNQTKQTLSEFVLSDDDNGWTKNMDEPVDSAEKENTPESNKFMRKKGSANLGANNKSSHKTAEYRLSNIELSENDNLFADVSLSKVITPTLGDDLLSKSINRFFEDSDDDLNIF